MKAQLTTIQLIDRKKLEALLIAYFKEIDTSKIKSESSIELDYPFLDLYWKDKNRQPFFIEYKDENIGFVLINDWIVNKEYNATYSIAEFYIKPSYRRNSIGNTIAQELFTRFKGKWEIRQSINNLIAIKFWRNCISRFTNGNYTELKIKVDSEIEYIQNFES